MRHQDDERPIEGTPRSEYEWRLLFDWRLNQVEKRLDNLTRAIVTVLGSVIVGVVLYLLATSGTGGGPPG